MTTFSIQLKTLHVATNQETGSFLTPKGDEPYFVVFGFRSRILAPGSTKIWLNSYKNEEWAENIVKGQSKKIPPKMGLCTFDQVSLTSATDLAEKRFPELLGTVTLSLESDGTSWGDIGELVDRARKALKREIASVVEGLNIFLLNPDTSVQHAIERIKVAVMPPFLSLVGTWFTSGADVDDFVGAHLMAFAAVDSTLAKIVPAKHEPHLTTGVAETIAPFKLKFRGDGAAYEVTAATRLA